MEETLGKRIVAHRKRLGMTQDQLAEKMGITAQAVSKWENDQSCPDISALPELADIFGITVDALLGRDNKEEPAAEEPPQEKPKKEPIFEAVVVDDDEEEDDKHHLEFHFNGGKKSYIGSAIWVIAVGAFYLANLLCSWGLSFWEVLWPTSLLTFGLFHLRSKSLFLSLSCILVGGYMITCHFLPNPVIQDNRIIWAAIIILFGISLLIDGIRKKKRKEKEILAYLGATLRSQRYMHTLGVAYTCANLAMCHMENSHDEKKARFNGDKKFCKSLDMEEDAFDYDAAFGSDRVSIDLPVMQEGDIDVSFGDYTVDLRGVETVAKNCQLDVDASFGELTILVPRRFAVNIHQDTSFSGISVNGQPDEAPDGTIYMDADVSFGNLVIEYV